MTQDDLKQAAATAAIKCIPDNAVVGVGTGSTVGFFIEALAKIRYQIAGTVASSLDTEAKLKAADIPLLDHRSAPVIDIYIDGADAYNNKCQLIKGGGGALTREKILATASKEFVCIVDETKAVDVLGAFPVAVEVTPFARSYVARDLAIMGGQPTYREGFVTDNKNIILDVYDWVLTNPREMEEKINQIPGVVCNGIFARRRADVLLVAKQDGTIQRVPSPI